MIGHGHVVPRPDGARARCGGVALCRQCKIEKAYRDLPHRATLTPELALACYEALMRHGNDGLDLPVFATIQLALLGIAFS